MVKRSAGYAWHADLLQYVGSKAAALELSTEPWVAT